MHNHIHTREENNVKQSKQANNISRSNRTTTLVGDQLESNNNISSRLM